MIRYHFTRIPVVSVICLLSSCCSLSLTNIYTHGSATDVVDGNQTQDQDPNFDLNLPNPL